ncbi:glycosyltransferase [Sphingomonas montanisoli]|nr:glycosyltransferase [Sphingomonas montanisoli]
MKDRRWYRHAPQRARTTMERPLRIGIVLHDFALGGTERIAVRLAVAWVEAGARVTIFCGSMNGPLIGLLHHSVEVISAKPAIPRGPGSRRKLGKAAAAFWSRQPVDALFVPGNFHWETVPATAALPAEIRPAIIAQVSASLDKPQRGRLRQWGFGLRMRRLLQGADAIVALFDQARDAADRIAGGRRATTIALPALADDVTSPRPIPSNRTIMAAGRLVPEKGFADLIDAFALLDDHDARLVIVGDGPDRKVLIDRAAARGVSDRLILPGYVADIRPWLDDARLFVLSSHFEGYPAVMVEALAAGRPVIATRCTAAAAPLIEGSGSGAVVPIGDPAAMARAIAAQLKAPDPDPRMLADCVAHHRIGPVAEAYMALFEQASAARKIVI